MQFCAYVAIQSNFAIITAIFLKKKGFGLIFYAIKCNFAIITAIFLKKKGFGLIFYAIKCNFFKKRCLANF